MRSETSKAKLLHKRKETGTITIDGDIGNQCYSGKVEIIERKREYKMELPSRESQIQLKSKCGINCNQ